MPDPEEMPTIEEAVEAYETDGRFAKVADGVSLDDSEFETLDYEALPPVEE